MDARNRRQELDAEEIRQLKQQVAAMQVRGCGWKCADVLACCGRESAHV